MTIYTTVIKAVQLSFASEILCVASSSVHEIKGVVECPGFHVEITEVLIAGIVFCTHVLLP